MSGHLGETDTRKASGGSQFWQDLQDDVADPEFRRMYVEESERLHQGADCRCGCTWAAHDSGGPCEDCECNEFAADHTSYWPCGDPTCERPGCQPA